MTEMTETTETMCVVEMYMQDYDVVLHGNPRVFAGRDEAEAALRSEGFREVGPSRAGLPADRGQPDEWGWYRDDGWEARVRECAVEG
jgi:hypothetical protein